MYVCKNCVSKQINIANPKLGQEGFSNVLDTKIFGKRSFVQESERTTYHIKVDDIMWWYQIYALKYVLRNHGSKLGFFSSDLHYVPTSALPFCRHCRVHLVPRQICWPCCRRRRDLRRCVAGGDSASCPAWYSSMPAGTGDLLGDLRGEVLFSSAKNKNKKFNVHKQILHQHLS